MMADSFETGTTTLARADQGGVLLNMSDVPIVEPSQQLPESELTQRRDRRQLRRRQNGPDELSLRRTRSAAQIPTRVARIDPVKAQSPHAPELASLVEKVAELQRQVARWEAAKQEPEVDKAVDQTRPVQSEDAAALEELNIMSLVIYCLQTAFVSGDWRDVVRAVVWVIVGTVLACGEILCLLAITVCGNWMRCVTTDDCLTGQACVRLLNTAGDYLKPTCQDCRYLSGREYGVAAWGNQFVAGEIEWFPNASVFCVEDQFEEALKV